MGQVSRARPVLDSRRPLGYQVKYKNTHWGEKTVAIDLSGGNPNMDYGQAEHTYKQFLLFAKVGVVFLVILLAGMAFFLT